MAGPRGRPPGRLRVYSLTTDSRLYTISSTLPVIAKVQRWVARPPLWRLWLIPWIPPLNRGTKGWSREARLGGPYCLDSNSVEIAHSFRLASTSFSDMAIQQAASTNLLTFLFLT
jgi:hypothetical protein